MSSPIPLELNLELLPTAQTPIAATDCGVTACTEKHFKDVLADENLLSEVMAKLKEALPEEIYTQIEEMVESGNGLPLAAIFSPESPLSQGLSRLRDGGQIPAVVAAALKSGTNQHSSGDKPADKALDSLGRTISDALSQLPNKGEGVGKQIQELIAAARAQSTVTEDASKLVIPKSFASDATVTQSTALGTAISGLAPPSSVQANSMFTPPPITAAMGGEAWGQAMGDRIMWMVGKGVQAASIRINPPHLGPIQVQLSVQNDQANVQMLVQHGVVKEALEAAMPRLREMLSEGNLNLVNVDVSHRENPDQSSQSAMFSENQREQMEQFLQEQGQMEEIEQEKPKYYVSTSLVDDYA